MFHVNEAKNGKGELTVKDGKMTIHISLVSDKIVNLYVGKAADAEKHYRCKITASGSAVGTVYSNECTIEKASAGN